MDDFVKTALLEICQDFIRDNEISCSEIVFQSDRVIENAYDFIYDICELVGYHEYKEEDDAV